MIRYTRGNLLESKAEALVNTVNEVGVMGKGIALMFREAFPESARVYEAACKRGEVRVGSVLVTENAALVGPRWILHFPTKKHWRQPSKLNWITEGLEDLARVLREKRIASVAIPPLGCGQGGLAWDRVRSEIERILENLPQTEVLVYEPTDAYMNAPKRTGVEELTPARALIVEAVRAYQVLDLGCTHLEIQKLAWFLHRFVGEQPVEDPLKLDFVANRYGPYADRLRHLLDALDGSYLHSERRLADARPLDPIRFDDQRQAALASYLASESMQPYQSALERTRALIRGFESPLGLELLATVDWILSRGACEPSVDSVRSVIAKWPAGVTAATRKLGLLDERLVAAALERLRVAGPGCLGTLQIATHAM